MGGREFCLKPFVVLAPVAAAVVVVVVVWEVFLARWSCVEGFTVSVEGAVEPVAPASRVCVIFPLQS